MFTGGHWKGRGPELPREKRLVRTKKKKVVRHFDVRREKNSLGPCCQGGSFGEKILRNHHPTERGGKGGYNLEKKK